MQSRFTKIVNRLKFQNNPISEPMKVNKLLRALSKERSSIKVSILETRGIKPFMVDKLIGTLQSYETKKFLEIEEPKGKKIQNFKN